MVTEALENKRLIPLTPTSHPNTYLQVFTSKGTILVMLLREAQAVGPVNTRDALNARSCLQIFTSKGIITANELREATEALDSKGRKQLGAQLVARAWTDPAFKARLLKNAAGGAAEMGIPSSNFTPKELPPGRMRQIAHAF